MKASVVFLFFLLIGTIGCGQIEQPVVAEQPKNESDASQDEVVVATLSEKASQAKDYCINHQMNTDFCILIDMSVHSGKYRFFVYDFAADQIVRSALCAHGCGKDDKKSTQETPVFGNEMGSYLTSLGKYKIGSRAYSQWGINVHYKLHGLETSNSNAYKRVVVLHSYTPVSTTEIHPDHLPLGWSFGCPVVDDATMHYLDAKLKKSKNPVLLWIYK